MSLGVEYGIFSCMFSARLVTMHLRIFHRFQRTRSNPSGTAELRFTARMNRSTARNPGPLFDIVLRYPICTCLGLLHSFDSFFQTFAMTKVGRRHARNAAKSARKIILASEPDIEAHIQHAEPRVAQEFARAENTLVENVSMGTETRAPLKLGGEIIDAHLCVPGEFGQGNIHVQIFINKCEDSL